LPQHDGQSVLPEEICLSIGGIDEAVGVEQEAITRFQRMETTLAKVAKSKAARIK